MRYSISDTAQWGDYVAGDRIIDAGTKDRMREFFLKFNQVNLQKDGLKKTKQDVQTLTQLLKKKKNMKLKLSVKNFVK